MEKEKEAFKALAVAMKPIIEDMWAVLMEHEIEDLASLTLSTDGYARFNHHGSDWEMVRAVGDEQFMIRNEIREAI